MRLTKKKAEVENLEERGVFKVVEGKVMEHQSGSSPKKAHRKPQYLREFICTDTILNGMWRVII